MKRRDFLARLSAILAGAVACQLPVPVPLKSPPPRRIEIGPNEAIDSVQLTLERDNFDATSFGDEYKERLPGLMSWRLTFYWKGIDPSDYLNKEFNMDWTFGNVRWHGVGRITTVKRRDNGWYFVEVVSTSSLSRTATRRDAVDSFVGFTKWLRTQTGDTL